MDCIAAFGPERAMFESNFRVDKWQLRLSRAVECVQAHRSQLLSCRKESSLGRHSTISNFSGWDNDPTANAAKCSATGNMPDWNRIVSAGAKRLSIEIRIRDAKW
jgi:hypothetical protein